MKTLMMTAFAAAMIGAVACTPPDSVKAAETPAAPAVAPSPDVHPFMIGVLQAYALKDGDITLPLGSADGPWKSPAIAGLLTAAGLPGDAVHLSIEPLLIKDGDRLVLIDTGAAGGMGTAGKLQASLRAAGFTPDQVTDVLISHYHDDHIGGLVTPAGGLAFPNAAIHISDADWTVMRAHPAGAALVAAITPKVQPFAPGAVILPSITAVPLAGHTEGHAGYRIVSGNEALLYIGDAMHSSVLSVAHPEWTNAWDIDGAAGVATRQALLPQAADQNLHLYANHFPYPGLGRIARDGAGYRWVPDA